MTIKLQQCQWVANRFFGHRLHYMNSFNSFGLESSILYISYKVHAFWFIDLIKKRRLKICREACRPFQIHAYCCIDLILKKMKMQAIPDISSIPGLCFRQCHSQDSWGTVSIDILSLSFWFFWVLLTVPYSTFLLTVIYQ